MRAPSSLSVTRSAALVAATALAFAATLGPRAARADESRPSAVPSASGPLAADFPDPFVLPSDGAYYAFATGAAGRHVQVARSTDLGAWAVLPDALPRLPAWASTEEGLTWAPAVLPRRGGYVLYYTTRDMASGFQCISRATSMWPEGPYVDDSQSAFVCQVRGPSRLCGSIDPSPFVDARGHAYLLWKSDENSATCRKDSRIWAARLTDDGLRLAGAPRPLLARDASWEQPLIEGPSMVASAGSYFLFYSANWYESARYAIGYATCVGPLGPCTKKTTRAPLLASGGAELGPGGQEFFRGPGGATWMAYHAWTAPITRYDDGGARVLHLARVTFPSARPVIAQQPERDRERSTERVATKM